MLPFACALPSQELAAGGGERGQLSSARFLPLRACPPSPISAGRQAGGELKWATVWRAQQGRARGVSTPNVLTAFAAPHKAHALSLGCQRLASHIPTGLAVPCLLRPASPASPLRMPDLSGLARGKSSPSHVPRVWASGGVALVLHFSPGAENNQREAQLLTHLGGRGESPRNAFPDSTHHVRR